MLLAGIACLAFVNNCHQKAIEEAEDERIYAWDLCQEASKWRVDPATIRDLRLLTHGDRKFYEQMAEVMRDAARPGASAATMSLKAEVDRDIPRLPESAEDRKAFNARMSALAGERRFELMGIR